MAPADRQQRNIEQGITEISMYAQAGRALIVQTFHRRPGTAGYLPK